MELLLLPSQKVVGHTLILANPPATPIDPSRMPPKKPY